MPGCFTSLEISPERNLSRYLNRIHQFPMLDRQEELDLGYRWRDRQDLASADKLVTSHLRLVAKIATGFRGYGLPMGELISEGNLGMVQAVKRFDPDKGFRLSTYAMWWIRASIQEYILRSWSLVKIGTTASQKKLFFNLRKIKGRIKAIEEGDLTPEHVAEIAHQLKVSETDVIQMNRRMSGPDPSLNVPIHDEMNGQWLDRMPSDAEDQESLLAADQELGSRRELLAGAMTVLSERERDILTERRLKDAPSTLEVLSRTYGISRERVRQIEVRAFEKIQQSVMEASAGQQLACRYQGAAIRAHGDLA